MWRLDSRRTHGEAQRKAAGGVDRARRAVVHGDRARPAPQA